MYHLFALAPLSLFVRDHTQALRTYGDRRYSSLSPLTRSLRTFVRGEPGPGKAPGPGMSPPLAGSSFRGGRDEERGRAVLAGEMGARLPRSTQQRVARTTRIWTHSIQPHASSTPTKKRGPWEPEEDEGKCRRKEGEVRRGKKGQRDGRFKYTCDSEGRIGQEEEKKGGGRRRAHRVKGQGSRV